MASETPEEGQIRPGPVIAPGIEPSIRPPRGLLPFRFARKALLSPFAISHRAVPADLSNRIVLESLVRDQCVTLLVDAVIPIQDVQVNLALGSARAFCPHKPREVGHGDQVFVDIESGQGHPARGSFVRGTVVAPHNEGAAGNEDHPGEISALLG